MILKLLLINYMVVLSLHEACSMTPKFSRKDSHRTSVCVGDTNTNEDTDYDVEEPEKVQQ